MAQSGAIRSRLETSKHRSEPASCPIRGVFRVFRQDRFARAVALQGSDASESVKLAFEFMILCAARTGEILRATWDEIEFDSHTWNHGQLRGSTLSLSDPLIMERVSVQVLIPDRKQCGGEKDTYDDDPAPRGARPEAG